MSYETRFGCKVKGVLHNESKIAELEAAKKQIEGLTGIARQIALDAIEKEMKIENTINIKTILKEKMGFNPIDVGQVSWQEEEYDKVMKEISKEYPNVIFELSGEGEERGDIWKNYYVNGKIQKCQARIVFDEFDENELK
jgi:hypothetical protein